MESKLINKRELAEEMNVSLTTIDNWIRKGLPYITRGDRDTAWGFNLEDCEAWRLNYERTSKGKAPIPKGSSGNLLRDLTTLACNHFFEYLTNKTEDKILEFCQKAGIKKKNAETLWASLYILFCTSFKEYREGDCFNVFLKEDSEEYDIDTVWNLMCGHSLQVTKTKPNVEANFKVPPKVSKIIGYDSYCREEGKK